MASSDSFLWYLDREQLGIGGVVRYKFIYTKTDDKENKIYFRLKNIEKSPIRAIQLLNGPFILYCEIVPYRYNEHSEFKPEDVEENTEIVYENQLQAGQTFNAELRLNHNSYKDTTEEGHQRYQWSVDIVSQIVINRRSTITYELMVGSDIKEMKSINHGPVDAINKEIELGFDKDKIYSAKGDLRHNNLQVLKQLTGDIWEPKPKNPNEPVHLVIITHGIFSNLTADMLYLRDRITECGGNIIVSGYNGNSGRTEQGVKKLGTRMAEYLVFLVEQLKQKYTIDKISFIGHSLGGVVQLYAIKHILLTEGSDYFKKANIEPYNLVCMASPLLGVLSEMSLWISWFLNLGTLGKTGRDLTLSKRKPGIRDLKMSIKGEQHKRDSFRPLLEVLPDEPVKSFLATFKHLTIYANAVNDGIVPLRTSALLYLDYEALGDVSQIKTSKSNDLNHPQDHDHELSRESTNIDEVSEIPAESPDEVEHSRRNAILENSKKLFFTNQSPNDGSGSPSSFNSNSSDSSHSSFWSKSKLSKRERLMSSITAKGSDSLDVSASSVLHPDSSNSGTSTLRRQDSTTSLIMPPKASAVESAFSVLFSPLPPRSYILDPHSRKDVIFHDKFYHFNNLPVNNSSTDSEKDGLFNTNWKLNKQVKIAKKYHMPELNWRKILVNLPPDAHNSIIVRRRFANGYGWRVVDHLCSELFTPSDSGDGSAHRNSPQTTSDHSHITSRSSQGSRTETGSNTSDSDHDHLSPDVSHYVPKVKM